MSRSTGATKGIPQPRLPKFMAGGGSTQPAARGVSQAPQRGIPQSAGRGVSQSPQRGATQSIGRGAPQQGGRGIPAGRGVSPPGSRGIPQPGRRGIPQPGSRTTTPPAGTRGIPQSPGRGAPASPRRGATQTTAGRGTGASPREPAPNSGKGIPRTGGKGIPQSQGRGTPPVGVRGIPSPGTRRGMPQPTRQDTPPLPQKGILKSGGGRGIPSPGVRRAPSPVGRAPPPPRGTQTPGRGRGISPPRMRILSQSTPGGRAIPQSPSGGRGIPPPGGRSVPPPRGRGVPPQGQREQREVPSSQCGKNISSAIEQGNTPVRRRDMPPPGMVHIETVLKERPSLRSQISDSRLGLRHPQTVTPSSPKQAQNTPPIKPRPILKPDNRTKQINEYDVVDDEEFSSCESHVYDEPDINGFITTDDEDEIERINFEKKSSESSPQQLRAFKQPYGEGLPKAQQATGSDSAASRKNDEPIYYILERPVSDGALLENLTSDEDFPLRKKTSESDLASGEDFGIPLPHGSIDWIPPGSIKGTGNRLSFCLDGSHLHLVNHFLCFLFSVLRLQG